MQYRVTLPNDYADLDDLLDVVGFVHFSYDVHAVFVDIDGYMQTVPIRCLRAERSGAEEQDLTDRYAESVKWLREHDNTTHPRRRVAS